MERLSKISSLEIELDSVLDSTTCISVFDLNSSCREIGFDQAKFFDDIGSDDFLRMLFVN